MKPAEYRASGVSWIHLETYFDAENPLDDADATNLAWAFIKTRYDYKDGEHLIAGNAKQNVAAFWRNVYKDLDLYCVQTTDLPYGKVP